MTLKENLEPVLNDSLLPILITLNQNGRLAQFLDIIDQRELLDPDVSGFVPLRDKKILILGDSRIKDEHIYKTLGEQGISKDRIELHTEYEPSKINVDSLKYTSEYSLILLGPIPHSMTGKGPYSSVVTRLETEIGFPPVKRLTAGGELKITKTSLIKALEEALYEELVVAF